MQQYFMIIFYLICHQIHWFIAIPMHFTYIHNASALHRMVKMQQPFKVKKKIKIKKLLAGIQSAHDVVNISSMSCEI